MQISHYGPCVTEESQSGCGICFRKDNYCIRMRPRRLNLLNSKRMHWWRHGVASKGFCWKISSLKMIGMLYNKKLERMRLLSYFRTGRKKHNSVQMLPKRRGLIYVIKSSMCKLSSSQLNLIGTTKRNWKESLTRQKEKRFSLAKKIKMRWRSWKESILNRLQNDQLNEEIRMHVEVTGSLQKEKADLQHEAATFSRDLVLLRQAEALHLQRGHNQARSIAESNNKVHNLEKSLGKLIRQYGSERRALEEDHQKSIVAFQAEKQMMRRLVQTKTKELKRIRQSAQQSLRERSEVEAFLIESLHYVTQQIRNTKKKASPRIGLSINESTSRKTLLQDPKQFSPSTLPHAPLSSLQFWPEASRKLGGKDYAVYRKKTYACDAKAKLQLKDQIEFDCLEQLNKIPVKLTQKVDISELTWTERENVLRYLFQKINNAHQLPQSELLSADKRDIYNFC